MPAPVMLDGKQLPWVDHAEHLGCILDKTTTMDRDCSRARNSFMRRASDIRDQLCFAEPLQKMTAINLYVCDGYGSMLWDLKSDACSSFFKAWNIQCRLAWNVSNMTHTYLVEDYFCPNLVSLRNQILGRYASFAQKLKVLQARKLDFCQIFLKMMSDLSIV